MSVALEEAAIAASKGEIPVGAVLVRDGRVLSRAHNLVETSNDATAHAEMLALRDASRQLGAWRLLGCSLYVTLEPCPMCAGALLQARLDRVVYGAPNHLLGADGSWVDLLRPAAPERDAVQSLAELSALDELVSADHRERIELSKLLRRADRSAKHPFHPDLEVTRGVLAAECADVMRTFFRRRRQNPDARPHPFP